MRVFENIKFLSNSPLYFEITPNENSGFYIPASGVAATSVVATSVVDKLVVVSGNTQGWHMFGENSSMINAKVNSGDLIFKNNL